MTCVFQRMGSGIEALMLYTADCCTSCMNLAWRLVREERFPEWASVLVTAQSSGRGQFKRQWHSPPGNLYGALRLPWIGPVWGNLLSLLLAESLHAILKEIGLAPTIKWPNDLLVSGKKVGGILVEERSGLIIAGIGLNLISAPHLNDLRNPLAPEAGCLGEFGVRLAPSDIWIPFVRDIRARVTETLLLGDPEQFVGRMASHLAYIGERILLDAHGDENRPVIFQGLDAGGGIKVQATDGERIFHSGSIYPVV
jgi:BirA family transcriptional regulator, biotin operon repressor / biotin---[acetyl-CoA-carboxylase] ligase